MGRKIKKAYDMVALLLETSLGRHLGNSKRLSTWEVSCGFAQQKKFLVGFSLHFK